MSLIEKIKIAMDRDFYQAVVTYLTRCEETNCNINELTRTGEGLIHRAVIIGKIPIIDLLIKYGADVNLLDHNELTPLDLAVLQGNIDVISLLLKNGARIPHDIITKAIENNVDDEVIKYLLKSGAQIPHDII